MKISTKQARNLRPTIGKILMALAFASVIGGMTVSSALGQHNENRSRAAHDRGRYDDRNQNYNYNRNDRRNQRAYWPTYQYQYPYRYSQPVYAPPPAYYYPDQRPGISHQSPGINLFFPLDLR
jgi:hypothetical protein